MSRLDVRSGLRCGAEAAGSSEVCLSPHRPPSARLTGFSPVTAAGPSPVCASLPSQIMILAERRKTPSTEFCLFCEKRHSACSQCCSRNAVVSIPVAAAGGWAEMMYVWRETADNPLLPPSLSPSLPPSPPKLHFCKVAAESLCCIS